MHPFHAFERQKIQPPWTSERREYILSGNFKLRHLRAENTTSPDPRGIDTPSLGI
jgi:hypothetical protein